MILLSDGLQLMLYVSNARTRLSRNHVLRIIYICLKVFKPYTEATRFGPIDNKIIPNKA